jgi:hypothetical protein
VQIIAAIIGSVLAFLGGVIAIDVRNFLFGARLVLDLTEHGSRVQTRHRDDGLGAVYIRVRVRNEGTSIAKSCRAFLTKIEKKEHGLFSSTEWAEACQLCWSSQADGSRALDLPTGIEHYMDVVRSNSKYTQIFPVVVTPLYIYENVFQEPGTYRLEIVVSGDGVYPKSCRVIVTHTGKWDEVKVDPEPGILAAAWTG